VDDSIETKKIELSYFDKHKLPIIINPDTGSIKYKSSDKINTTSEIELESEPHLIHRKLNLGSTETVTTTKASMSCLSEQKILNIYDILNCEENLANRSLETHDSICHVKNFIVVDDEKLTRRSSIRLLKSTLEKMGTSYRIIEAEDGAECIFISYKLISLGLKISFILSDQTMNYILGTTSANILKEITTQKNLQSIPFILLSAFNHFEINEAISKFISKPLTKEKIFDALKKFVE
jgi:hypothetical protein